jgi:hypothetical protein
MTMSDFFGKLKSGAGKVAFEADKMARLNRVQGELNQIKKQIETHFTKLGEMVYHQYTNPQGESPSFDAECQAIADLERQAEVKGEDIKRINAENYAPQPTAQVASTPPVPSMPVSPPPAADASAPFQPPTPAAVDPTAAPRSRFCPNCGHEVAPNVKFCPDCGAKMP